MPLLAYTPWAPSRVDMCALQIFIIIIIITQFWKCCLYGKLNNYVPNWEFQDAVTWSETFVVSLDHTLKTPGSDLTRKRVPWGQTHSWVRLIWNPGKNNRNLSPKCLSNSDSGSVWPGFRVGLTPKWVWPLGLFSGSNLTREFLECRFRP